MSYREFAASWKSIASMSVWSDVFIKNEPMLFAAASSFAEENGGVITREFLSTLPKDESFVIDSRVHMLKNGWYPAIPGWHLDSIPRSKTNRQPDFTLGTSNLDCYVAVVGSVAMTEFITPGRSIRLWCPDGKRWSEFSRDINSMIRDGEVTTQRIKPSTVVRFGPNDFHRATPAEGDGWRFFIRAVRGSATPHANEIRRQTQVYLHELEAGW